MKNLIKAQLYQISKTRVYLWVFLIFAGLSAMFGAVEYLSGKDMLDEGQLLTASDYATRMGAISTFSIMGMAFFTGFICADDFSDKTCNCEILSGRLRSAAFFARAAVAVAVSTLFGLITMALALGVSAALTGWGDSIPLSAAVGRILLMAFPFFRLCCLFVLASYILKKPGLVALSAYCMIMALSMISADKEAAANVLTAVSNISMIMQYDSWVSYGLESGTYVIYEPALGAAKIASTIAASLSAGAVYLGIGCSYFCGDDLE